MLSCNVVYIDSGGKKFCMRGDFAGILKRGQFRGALWVFGVSLAIRLLMDAVFLLRFGAHATNHVETWFYVGLLEGTKLPAGGIYDPTVWLLRAFGVVFSGGSGFLGVLAASAILSSITAVGLFYLVDMLYERKAAFASGVVYAAMVQPIALSMSGFTHDHLQLPFMMALLVCTIKAADAFARRDCGGAAVYAAVFALAAYNALRVNESAKVALAICAAYAGYRLLEKLSQERKASSVYPAYLSFLLIAITAGGFFVLPRILSNTISALPQGIGGSDDVLPTGLLTLWLRYNVLLVLAPMGLLSAYRRKDIVGICLLTSGLAIAMVMDRGTRISDLGFAVIVGFALSDFSNVRNKAKHLRATAAWAACLFAFMLVFAQARLPYVLVFILAAAWMARAVWRGNIAWALAALVFAGIATNMVFVLASSPRGVATEAEFKLLDWLSKNNEGGKVLVSWDHGYMSEAVSGLESVSSPNGIDRRVHDMLWMPEEQSALSLSGAGVRYVLARSDSITLAQDDSGRRGFRLFGGLVFSPKSPPAVRYADRYAIYKMANNRTEASLVLVRQEYDPESQVRYMLYKVVGQPPEQGVLLVGGLAQNTGARLQAVVNVTVASGQLVQSEYFNQTFEPGGTTDVLYRLSADFMSPNCSISAQAATGDWPAGKAVQFPVVFC
jgi:hypothetical protein